MIAGEIVIETGNTDFCMSKGVLFDKEKITLIYYPPTKKNKTYTIPTSVSDVYATAFQDNKHLKTLKTPFWGRNISEVKSNSIQKIYIDKMSKKKFDLKESSFFPNFSSEMPKLKTIMLGKEPAHYKLVSGIVYANGGKALAWYPSAKKDKSFRIPKKTKTDVSYLRNPYLEDIYVHAQFKFHAFDFCDLFDDSRTCLPKLKNIHVDSRNPYHTSLDGVLYNKKKTKLIYYPGNREASTYVVPHSVTTFWDSAFQDVTRKLVIKLPPMIEDIMSKNYGFGTVMRKEGFKYPDYADRYKNITFMVKKDSKTHQTLKRWEFDYKFY